MDYFLRVYLQEKMYTGKLCTAVELKETICSQIAIILVDMLSLTVFELRERERERFSLVWFGGI